MATVATGEVLDVPTAAVRIGCGEQRLRRALRRRPDLEARVPRLAGRRLIPADLLGEIAAEIKATTPAWVAGG